MSTAHEPSPELVGRRSVPSRRVFQIAVIATGVRRAWPLLVVGGTVAAYAGLNVGRLGAESYWSDELLTVGFANEWLGAMLRLLSDDWHPPAYGSVVWAWIRVTGDASEATVRAISLVGIVIGIATLGWVTWRRIGPGAAYVFLVLAASSSAVSSFAHEARPHGPAFALVCLVTAAWLVALTEAPIRRLTIVLFGTTGGLAALTSYYALMVYGLEVAVVLGWLAARRRWREQPFTAFAIGASMVPVGLWLAVSWRALGSSSTPLLDWAWAQEVFGWLGAPYTVAVVGPAGTGVPPVQLVAGVLGIAGLLVVAGLAVHAKRGDPGATREQRSLWLGAACLGVGIVAMGIAVAESLLLAPSFHYRSALAILPVLYVGLGAAAAAPFGRRAQLAGATATVGLIVIAALTPAPAEWTKDDWRGAATIAVTEVRHGLAPDHLVVVESPWATRVDWTLSLNIAADRTAPATDLPAELRSLAWIDGPEDLAAIPAGDRVVVLAFHYWSWDRHAAIVDETAARFGPCEDRSVVGISVLDCGTQRAARAP
jgi:hypothetical protein